jgi:hypothetical protein
MVILKKAKIVNFYPRGGITLHFHTRLVCGKYLPDIESDIKLI